MKPNKKTRLRSSQRSFDYTSLEKRELLAGNVHVSFADGRLQIFGDSSSNNIQIDQWEGQRFRISGSGTTINNHSGALHLRGPIVSFEAYLGQGNDVLILNGIKVQQDINIEGHLGSDSLRLRNVEARDIRVDAGNGIDCIDIDGAEARKNMILRVGNDVNLVAFNAVNVSQDLYLLGAGSTSTTYLVAGDLNVGRDLWSSYGAGSDRLMFCGETLIGRNAEFWLGLGNDTFAAVAERVSQNFVVAGSLKVYAGMGNDLVCFDQNVSTTDGAFAVGGAGQNTLLDTNQQSQYDQFHQFTETQPNRQFNVAMNLLEGWGIDVETYGGVKLVVDSNTFGVTVKDASPTISTQWDRLAQEAVRIAKTGPTIASRAYGMVHTAMYDAWSAYDPQARSTLMGDDLQRPSYENTQLNKLRAMSFAAYRVLVDLFPMQKPIFDGLMSQLKLDVTNTTVNPATPAGIGNRMAQKTLEFRHQDGSNQLGTDPQGTAGVTYSDVSNYQPLNTHGNLVDIEHWTPERVPITNPNGPIQSYLTPHWGGVTPFGISDIADFRAPTPEPFLMVAGASVDYQAKTITLSNGTVLAINKNLIGTVINPKFVQQFQEIVDYSANLTDKQKLIAEFWENGGGTSFPPGTWLGFGQYVSARDNHSLDQDAQLYFALGNAVMNAGIATWETKRTYDYARPVRAIRDLGSLGLIGEYDANLGGYAIDAWMPDVGTQRILATEFITYQPLDSHPSPPFPDYTSGHSSFSASAAEILRRFTGNDFFGAKANFDPGSSRVQSGLIPSQKVTLSWTTFTEAAVEAGISRVYGGIHFQDANLNGSTLGIGIGIATWSATQKLIHGIA